MQWLRSQRIGSEAGFTLIELLAVTAILIILSLFTVPLYNALTDKARLATSLEDLRVIEEALEAFHAEYGHYPTRLGHLAKYGYLRKNFSFRSPWSNDLKTRYYFYAVDDLGWPSAFILGDPGPQTECSQKSPVTLHASYKELLPCGTNPDGPARVFAGSEPSVILSPAERPLPKSLSLFRQRCDPKVEQDMMVAPGCVVKTES